MITFHMHDLDAEITTAFCSIYEDMVKKVLLEMKAIRQSLLLLKKKVLKKRRLCCRIHFEVRYYALDERPFKYFAKVYGGRGEVKILFCIIQGEKRGKI